MTLLIAVLVNYGLNMSQWLYTLAGVIWIVEIILKVLTADTIRRG